MYFDPSGCWVLSIGLEGLAAYALGVYIGVAINIDSYYNVSVAYSLGFAIITNIAAYIQGYIAFYAGMNNASTLNGWGISVGTSFSMGLHASGSMAFDVDFSGRTGGRICIGLGAGVSVAPVPYFEVRVGYTGVLKSFNLLSTLNDRRNNFNRVYRILGVTVKFEKTSKYIVIYIKNLGISVYLYGDRRIKIR